MLAIFTRRAWLRLLAGGAMIRGYAEVPARVGTLAWNREERPEVSLERRYRADAQVLLFGLSLLHRQGVGGGGVLWREYESGDPARLLEFRGFSLPERAAGLNRLGLIRELARTARNGGGESLYFGLMTASPEESVDEARKALHSNSKEQVYTAVDGHIQGGATETAVAHFSAPAGVSGEHAAELVERARRALASVEKVSASDADSSLPFLQAMAGLLARPDGLEGRYLYCGRPYRIHLSRAVDGKAAATFRERGLIGKDTAVLRVAGRVRRESGGKESSFRLWIPAGDPRPLPLRIEYQPKSYLRLTFEAVQRD